MSVDEDGKKIMDGFQPFYFHQPMPHMGDRRVTDEDLRRQWTSLYFSTTEPRKSRSRFFWWLW